MMYFFLGSKSHFTHTFFLFFRLTIFAISTVAIKFFNTYEEEKRYGSDRKEQGIVSHCAANPYGRQNHILVIL